MLMNCYRLLILVCSFVLTGCSLFSPVKLQPQHEYLINTAPAVAVKKPGHATLMVTMPSTTPVYNTKEMAYTTYPHQIAYFANNSWADTPSNMLQALIVQTLQNTHYYRSVVAAPFPAHYDLILHTALVKLQQDFTRQPSVIRLTLQAELISANTNQVISSKAFTIVRPAPRNDPYGGVIAANRAASDLMRQLVNFCLFIRIAN